MWTELPVVRIYKHRCPRHAWVWLCRMCGIPLESPRPYILLLEGSGMHRDFEERVHV